MSPFLCMECCKDLRLCNTMADMRIWAWIGGFLWAFRNVMKSRLLLTSVTCGSALSQVATIFC